MDQPGQVYPVGWAWLFHAIFPPACMSGWWGNLELMILRTSGSWILGLPGYPEYGHTAGVVKTDRAVRRRAWVWRVGDGHGGR